MSSVTNNFEIPSKKEIAEALGQTRLSDEVYTDMISLIKVINDFDQPIPFEYAHYRAYHDYEFSLPPSAERANRRLKDRVDRLNKWDIETVHYIVGRIPEASLWLDSVVAKCGLGEVSSDNMNEVQRACEAISKERQRKYREATGMELQERAIERSDDILSKSDTIGEAVDSVVSDVAELAVDILPQREESRSQGTKSSGGISNEVIVQRVLEADGIKEESEASGLPYYSSSDSDDEDILIRSSHGEVHVEIKSVNTRERARRALSGGGEWVIIGFFNDANDVRNDILGGNQQGMSWREQATVSYVPPSLLDEMEDLDHMDENKDEVLELTNENGNQFLRANTQFALDMRQYVNNGTPL